MRIKAALAAIAIVAAPFAASAVTVEGGDFIEGGVENFIGVGIVSDGNNVDAMSAAPEAFTYKFTATGPLKVFGAFTVNGLSTFSGLDIEVNGVDAPSMSGMGDTLTADISTLVLASGDMFTIDISYDSGLGDVDFRINTTPVPLPAAGWMFLSALAGMGFLARKRSA